MASKGGTPPAPVVLLHVAQILAAGAALWEVVQGFGLWTRKVGVHVPDLVPGTTSLQHALLLAVAYCFTVWAIAARRRAGWWVALALAVWGVAWYATNGRAWYVHALVLLVAVLPPTRSYLDA